MLIFTYIAGLFILAGITLCVLPRKWYKSSPIDLRILGVWIIMISGGALIASWALCSVYTLFNTYILSWGFAL